MASFEIDDIRGTFDGETWTIDDPFLSGELLPRLAALYENEQGGAGYNPDRTNSILTFVMDLAGGRVIDPDPAAEADHVPGRVYQKQKVEGV